MSRLRHQVLTGWRGIQLLLAIIVLILSSQPGWASEQIRTHRYVSGVYDPVQLPDGSWVGGYVVPPLKDPDTGKYLQAREVWVVDDLVPALPAGYIVCQDLNGDGICGGTLEPFVEGCGHEEWFDSDHEFVFFNPRFPVTVEVPVFRVGISDPGACLASQGLIKLRYTDPITNP